MNPSLVSIVRYEKPYESVRKAVELAGGLSHLKPSDHVFIKPNIVFWTTKTVIPKWGVITTSRVVEDMVRLLKDLGIHHIQFNVVVPEELEEAQEVPDEHEDLIVRVSGYAAYFVDLTETLQDDIIARTEQAFVG